MSASSTGANSPERYRSAETTSVTVVIGGGLAARQSNGTMAMGSWEALP